MISALALERSSPWRTAGVMACFLPVVMFAAPMLWRAAMRPAASPISVSFSDAVATSMAAATLVGVIAFIVGLPAGVLAGLYRLPGGSILLPLIALAALVPSFLWAIGWSSLSQRLGPIAIDAVNSLGGVVLALLSGAAPLVFITSFVATRGLTASQVEAVRLGGGERAVMLHACRHTAPPAALGAALAAVLTLGDPGPGTILGRRTAAADILTTFSAQYDFGLAARQSLVLAAVALAVMVPVVATAGPRLADAVLARQLRPAPRSASRRAGLAGGAIICFVVLVTAGLPLAGLLWPLLGGVEARRALDALARTGGSTLIYSVGAGALAAVLGLACGVLTGRSTRGRIIVLAGSILVLVVPPTMISLGLVEIGSAAPPAADALLRSRLTVCLALAARLFPIAAVLGMRAFGGMAPSWAQAAAVHGVPLSRYMLRVVGPWLAPPGIAAGMLVALLAAADVGTALLLHPPGYPSLPLTIFTVMANAPESLVASLCMVYVITATLLLGVTTACLRRQAR